MNIVLNDLRQRGACRDVDSDIFFPSFDSPSSTAAAIAVCEKCVVQDVCLEWALKNDESGVWGGTSEATRRSIKRPRVRSKCISCGSADVVTNGDTRHEFCVDCGLSWSF